MTQEDIVKTQEIFAKKLRGLLDENKINQSELAEMLQVSESTVGKWLLKKALPRMGIIEKLSSIFNCPKSYLLEENETRRSYYLNPEAAKMAQEIRPFLKINDSFKKIVITSDIPKPFYNNQGILIMNVYDFLLNADSLEL